MKMDGKTLMRLEFNKIQDMLKGYTHFEGGRQEVENIKPASDYELVNRWLDETEEAMEFLRLQEPLFLKGLKMVDKEINKARIKALLTPEELYNIYLLLKGAHNAKKYLTHEKYPRLSRLVLGIEELYFLEKAIAKAISEEGKIKDDASAALKNIRSQVNVARIRIREYLQNFVRSEQNQRFLQEAIITERDGRYVVPVKQEYRHEVKGIVHDESASGATVFIEPLAVVEQNNKIRMLLLEEKREVERILRELSDKAASCAEELKRNLQILSRLDFIFARAYMAYKTDSYRPLINTQGVIEIEKGRHPLLGKKAVPLNIHLGREFDILVITGPNTGGKTVTLKTVGLLTLMAMCGLFIPAREKSKIALFKNIYVDIGDEQSIEQSLSTFSSHMTNIISILENMDENSLVLLDELGAGTDPVEGAALARVILEEILRKGAKAIVSTHQSELKNFAYQQERVENACVEFDPVTLKPTYELTIGMPGQSNAFEIASRLGLPHYLVERARMMVPESEAEISNMIKRMKEAKNYYDNLLRELEEEKKKLKEEREILLKEKAKFNQEKDEILSRARREAEAYVRQIRREADEALQEWKELLKKKEEPPKWHEIEKGRQKLKRISLNRMEAEEELELKPDREIKAGDYVFIKSLSQKGYVLEPPNKLGEVVVQAGIMKLTVKEKDIIVAEAPEEKEIKWKAETFLKKAQHISNEIDVRGKLAEEALMEIEKYLEDANLVGLSPVRIIHGKGTGALRKAVREYLKNHRYVKSFRDGMLNEGGFGVTVVELR
ncbi:DNA mismatch repair protein, MutS family [Thermosyntropha lipolytica DSM 11003]|uniref:Endonuclease MutS2 n=2 Tax=Thermosyntropha TaxID=54293 RepID=A0A1M5K770_9FIRM|nr:DNA mismatch repair protein, MutS family [Thermosyntropha lipolytica DSM 11003]